MVSAQGRHGAGMVSAQGRHGAGMVSAQGRHGAGMVSAQSQHGAGRVPILSVLALLYEEVMNLWAAHNEATAHRCDAPAVIDQTGASLTHAELSSAAARVSGGLAAQGLEPGQVIGGFLPNRACWPILALGAARLGVGVLGLNTRFREAELDHLTNVGQVDFAAIPDSFLGLDAIALFQDLQRPIHLIVDGTTTPAARTPARAATAPWSDLLDGAPAESTDNQSVPLIGFTTSGTTGFPKIAMHTNAQGVAHLTNVVNTFGYSGETVALVPLPMCGAFGYSIAMSVLLAGGLVVLHETWDPVAAVDAMIEHGVTYFAGGDLMLIDTANVEAFPKVTTWTGGTFGDFANAAQEAVDTTAARSGGLVRLSGVYGSSEGFALMSQWPLDAPMEQRVRAGGYVVGPTMHVRCTDPDTAEVLAHHEQGELQFQGPNMITAYLNNPDATAKAFTEDGWYRSGDLGYTVPPHDDGRDGFVYLSRLGDSLRLRGFLCDPAEIEHHLELHPAVNLAQVVGAHREGEGDVAVAFVQLTEGSGPIAEGVLGEHCKDGLANYKRPAHIEFVDKFPVTEGPNGVKIRKVELRERAAALVGNT